MSAVNVFVSFDIAHDQELYELLLEQSRVPDSSFEVCACSEPPPASNSSNERLRERIHGADEMIVICGEHTQDSVPMNVELGIARQEETPYFLLWGAAGVDVLETDRLETCRRDVQLDSADLAGTGRVHHSKGTLG